MQLVETGDAEEYIAKDQKRPPLADDLEALRIAAASPSRCDGFFALRASVLATNNRSIAMLLSAGFTPLSSSGILREYELGL